MTEYVLRVTLACPEAMMPDANQLALVLGESAADDGTFRAANQRDANGDLYATASTVATPTFQTKASGELVAPDHAPDADLEAARRAQAALVIYDPDNPVQASPDILWAYVEAAPGDARAALDLAGLEPVPQEIVV